MGGGYLQPLIEGDLGGGGILNGQADGLLLIAVAQGQVIGACLAQIHLGQVGYKADLAKVCKLCGKLIQRHAFRAQLDGQVMELDLIVMPAEVTGGDQGQNQQRGEDDAENAKYFQFHEIPLSVFICSRSCRQNALFTGGPGGAIPLSAA